MQKYYFRQCTSTLLDRTFGLRKVFSSLSLDTWLQAEIALSEKEKGILENYPNRKNWINESTEDSHQLGIVSTRDLWSMNHQVHQIYCFDDHSLHTRYSCSLARQSWAKAASAIVDAPASIVHDLNTRARPLW